MAHVGGTRGQHPLGRFSLDANVTMDFDNRRHRMSPTQVGSAQVGVGQVSADQVAAV